MGVQPAAGPGTTTVTSAVPLFPSLVAVIVAAPAATPITSPLVVTVATDPLLVAHDTTRPDRALPPASFGVAVSWIVCPVSSAADPGLTVTDATGTVVTVIAAVPACPSLVAVMVAEPAVTPLTRPVLVTVATLVLLDVHVTARPDSALPLASLGVAVSCTVWPCGTLADAGLTLTDVTGTAVTTIVAVPACPSLVAVIVAVPPPTPVTRPLPLTVAAELLLETHETARPVSGLPAASRGVAASCTVCPCCRFAEAGLTLTDATGTVETVMLDTPLLPSTVAVIVAVPPVAPVTSPDPSTVATLGLLEPHVAARPVSPLPAESRGVALSCTAPPTTTLAAAGVTLTAATGTAATVTIAVSDGPVALAVATTLYWPVGWGARYSP